MAESSGPRLSPSVDGLRPIVDNDAARVAADAAWQPRPSALGLLLRRWARAFNIWLWLFVFLPTLAAGVYYFGIAADRYMSEADFIVRTDTPNGATGLLGTLLQSTGLSRSTDDTFSVNAFMQSRDAARLLEQHDHLRDVFDRPEADFVTRFPNRLTGSSFEKLYQHYLDYVDVTYDSVTGVTRLRVEAYRPQDAQRIADALLSYSEDLVNQLNARAEQDSLEVARHEVQLAEANLEKIEADRAALGQAPATGRAGPNNANSSFSRFDALALQRDLAEKSLASATESLEAARVRAQSQQLYIEHVVEPNLPDYPLYPQRILSFVLVTVTCFVAYGIAWLLVAGIREHAAA
jgi:capsular polysaccharide transport system permease protein